MSYRDINVNEMYTSREVIQVLKVEDKGKKGKERLVYFKVLGEKIIETLPLSIFKREYEYNSAITNVLKKKLVFD